MNNIIKNFQSSELNEDIWTEWREMTGNGIVSASEDDIRNLYAKMATFKSHAEINLGLMESRKNSAKVKLEIKKAELLRIKYSDGSMNSRLAMVESDKDYINVLENLSDREDDLSIQKATVFMCDTACSSLSRELSMRLK